MGEYRECSASRCPSRGINYTTQTLPQECLRMGGLEDGDMAFDFEVDGMFGYPGPISKAGTRV